MVEMDWMDTEYIETVLKDKKGLEFQKYVENFLRKKYVGEFQQVDSKGKLGDGGKDGYIRSTREYFAISSQEDDLPRKIRRDFMSCVNKNLLVNKFIFVSYQKIGPKECDVLDQLQLNYPDIKFETMNVRHIAKEMVHFSKRDVLAVLGKPLPFLDPNIIYFHEEREKRVSFTLWESAKDSVPVYIAVAVVCGLFCGISLHYMTESAMLLAFVGSLALLFVYYKLGKKSLKNFKYAHKIVFLILTDRLRRGGETILNENFHLTVSWDQGWNFSIRHRSADCIKKGCSGKVYLYNTEVNTFIGRCEKDDINHTYNVDRNFYADLN